MPIAIRIYRSFDDFQRDELRRLEQLELGLDDLPDDAARADLAPLDLLARLPSCPRNDPGEPGGDLS